MANIEKSTSVDALYNFVQESETTTLNKNLSETSLGSTSGLITVKQTEGENWDKSHACARNVLFSYDLSLSLTLHSSFCFLSSTSTIHLFFTEFPLWLFLKMCYVCAIVVSYDMARNGWLDLKENKWNKSNSSHFHCVRL